MNDYSLINKKTYDFLACDYEMRLNNPDKDYIEVGKDICKCVFETNLIRSKQENNKIINVLEIGCGPGAVLMELNHYSNVQVYAIDISETMAKFARKHCPNIKIKVADVFKIDDIKKFFKIDHKFDVIIMAAFIHLFSADDTKVLLSKVKEWADENAVIYIDTTAEPFFKNGSIIEKRSFGGLKLNYFRTLWTKETLNSFLIENGFEIIDQYLHSAKFERRIWIRTVIKKGKGGKG